MKKGLKITKKDSRDFKLGSITRLPDLESLPEEFMLGKGKIRDQKDSDFCTGFASCGASELQEKVVLSPEWSFAVGKMIEGHPEKWGLSIRDVLKGHQTYGAVESTDNPYSLNNRDENFLRYIDNYPKKLFSKAIIHKKKAYVKVDGQYDNFDNIRAAIYHFRKEKRAVISGVLWNWDLDEPVIPNRVTSRGIPHCIYYVGWKKINGQTMLILSTSSGKEAGDNGLFYIPRTVVNYTMNLFGGYLFVDEDPERLKEVNWTKVQLALNKLKVLLQKLINVLKI